MFDVAGVGVTPARAAYFSRKMHHRDGRMKSKIIKGIIVCARVFSCGSAR